jgi:hypothetical protein
LASLASLVSLPRALAQRQKHKKQTKHKQQKQKRMLSQGVSFFLFENIERK